MSKFNIMAVLLAAALLAPAAHAEQTLEKTLYEQIGGEPVLRKTVEEFVLIMEDDDRINFAFGNTDITKFKQLLFEQLCNVTGGPCQYTGRSMEESHRELAIDNAMFNALAEDVYLAFDRVGVPYRLQNKVMAIFAPMQKDMVKSHPPTVAPKPAASSN